MRRLLNFFRKNLDSDISREIEFHISERVDELVAAGMDEESAHYLARRQFGNRTSMQERTRDMNLAGWLEEWFADIRLTFKRLLKEPLFALMALLSLALGIGANTAVYTLINDVMLKTLPVADPARLLSWGTADNGGVQDGLAGAIDLFPYDFARQVEGDRTVFAETASYGSFPIEVAARTPGSPAAVRALSQLVSGNYFHVLGIQPSLGRMFTSNDASAPGKNTVVVLSFGFWQRQLASDPSIIGKPVVINGTAFEVVGVAPQTFFGVSLDADPDMWIPLTMQPQVMLRDSLLNPDGMCWLHLISRLPPGAANLDPARGEWASLQLRRNLMQRRGGALDAPAMKEIRESYVDLQPGGRGITHLRSQYRDPLRFLIAVTLVVLLIACANLASFSLARMTTREKEIVARLALGAGRARIVRQVMTEGLVLSLLGGILGLAFATTAVKALLAYVTASSQRTPLDPTPDATVLAFTFAVTLLTGLLFSIVPAIRTSQVEIAPRLRATSRGVTGGSGSSRPGRLPLSRILVAIQVALSLLLLSVAGLFVQTLRNLDQQGFGIRRQNALLVDFDAHVAGYKSTQIDRYNNRLLEQLRAVPGVRSVSLSALPPIAHGSWTSVVFTGLGPGVLSRPIRPDENIGSYVNAVTADYWDACGIALVSGRLIEDHDAGNATEKLAVVSRRFVEKFFPAPRQALGQLVSIAGTEGQWRIVGVVADGRYVSARDKPPPMIYLPLRQLSGDNAFASSLELYFAAGDPDRIMAQVRQAFAAVDPNVTINRIETFAREADRFLSQERLVSQLSSFFSLSALALACIGLYGVMSHSVAGRSNEIGIRIALGAKASAIRAMILRETFVMLAAGVVIGIPASLAAARAVQSQLFGIAPFDPATLLLSVAVIAAVTLAAGWWPAWRAAQVDPITALREE